MQFEYKKLAYPGLHWLIEGNSPIHTLLTHDWPIVLDSSQQTDTPNLGRYDIVTSYPMLKLSQSNHQIRIEDCVFPRLSREYPLTDSVFSILKQLLARYPGTDDTLSLPFTGGAAGYFSYDLGKSLEQIRACAQDDMHCPDMAVGIYDWAYVVDHQNQEAYIVRHGHDIRFSLSDMEQWVTQPSLPSDNPFVLTQTWQSNLTKDDYLAKFQQTKQHILAGDCYQINLAQRFSSRYQGDPWYAYRTLASNNSAPFSAFLHFDDITLLSLSPERFLSVRNQQVESKPIKGTLARQKDPARDQQAAQQLQQSEKDRAENLMIVDLLRNDISHCCKLGSVKVPTLFAIESYPAVHHLVSTVTGELLQNQHALDLLQACFPGGSITGAPKIMAMQLIEQLEPQRRAIYCGSIGYIGFDGNMDTNIAIRTLLCKNNHIYCWGGGGLVADSDAEKEYQETLDKVSKILPILAS